MQPRFSHFFEVKVYHRLENTSEYEEIPEIIKVKIASNKDLRSYQVLNGLFGENSTITFFTQDDIEKIKPNDRVLFMSEYKIVSNTGVFLNKNRNLANYIFDDDYIIQNSPKGFSIQ